MRIKLRWEAIELENKEIELNKELEKTFIPDIVENGDTLKQLPARSRYLLFKRQSAWTPSQLHRGEILFRRYPSLEQTYNLSMQLGQIYSTTKDNGVTFTKLAQWYDKVEKAGYKSFNTVARSIQAHYLTILNFFNTRSTNASAESKALRAAFRGGKMLAFSCIDWQIFMHKDLPPDFPLDPSVFE
ncbi:MAG TPA: transposase [Cytophagaceae bacterium]|jgi:hypothetical protein